MAGVKRIKIGDESLVRILIDKMLESNNSNYDFVIKNQTIDGQPWCNHFEWTQKESDKYKEWFMDLFKNNVSPRMSKKSIEREYQWFNMMYGLKVKED